MCVYCMHVCMCVTVQTTEEVFHVLSMRLSDVKAYLRHFLSIHESEPVSPQRRVSYPLYGCFLRFIFLTIHTQGMGSPLIASEIARLLFHCSIQGQFNPTPGIGVYSPFQHCRPMCNEGFFPPFFTE